MTRSEALKEAESCLKWVADANLMRYSDSQLAEMARAKAEAGRGFIELARELREGGEPRTDA